jgi:hypothetical protein
MTQPEALRLAEILEHPGVPLNVEEAAAAELRRLHDENEALREANEAFGKRQEWWNERMFALEQQRDALTEVLKLARPYISTCTMDGYHAEVNAYAAIAKAEGEEA